ncbi:Wzz/FepE/Etk N-terminal domain-containing protein [Streptomyces caniscabiei]|uniref:YveK family protein n=1 Tax=Streptomyces caniscabiei TaxID=2746961 RepID=UPI0029A63DFC|nr:Wzz/FepE/Etk N-terminal domain-containing protein [Streptomyces caniscabiei]MDX2776126.1 Wzz/FepE/Etk N-terminal domain-containing protein [Streptomyces caniscabiei]
MQEINPYQLLQYYLKKWVVIVSLTAVGLVAGLVYSFVLQTPLYKSDATLILIDPEKPSTATQDATLINNYVELFKSRKVLEPVIDKLNLSESYEQLTSSVTATSEKDTEVIKISVSSENAETSMMIADEAIASFKQEIGRLYDKDNVEIVDRANRPTVPYNVHAALQIVLSMTAGLVVALTALFFAYDVSRSKDAPMTKEKPRSKKNVPDVPSALQNQGTGPEVPPRAPVSDVVNMLIGTEVGPRRKKPRKQKPGKRTRK